MLSLLSIVALGFFLGMRHATDPDHVIAVTTIVARHRTLKHAAVIGACWGVGHTLTILFVGGGIILFGWVIPTRVGLSMEFSVGLMLILLGVLNLTGILRWITEAVVPASDKDPGGPVHVHPHTHRGYIHTRAPAPDVDLHERAGATVPPNGIRGIFGRLGAYHVLRPLVVGIVHGLAGSAAVALLVLATIHDAKWALGYLFLFGLGTIVGMILITFGIVLPFARTEQKVARFNGVISVASGLLSVGFGLFLVYHIGFVNGLFTTHPQWSPR